MVLTGSRWGASRKRCCGRRHAPVLTLPPGAAPSAATLDYRTILCPTDFSLSSECGVDFALSMARRSHATVTVLHVIETVDDDADPIDRRALTGHHTDTRYEEEAQALHSRLATHVQPSDRVSELIATGKPHRAILRVAGDRRADLIVIGVRGRGPVDLTLFGSTTNQVVRRAVCPVITVRSRGAES